MVFRWNGSVDSPRPYRFGEGGRAVLRRRNCDSKTRDAADVSKRVSLVSLRVMANEKGLSVQVNARAESSGLTPSLPAGRGQTDS